MTTPECIKCGHLAPHGHVPAYTCPRCLNEIWVRLDYQLHTIEVQLANVRKVLKYFEGGAACDEGK